MNTFNFLATASLAALLVACGGAKSAQSSATETAKSADPAAVCIQMMEKSRDCTDEYIPALVDLRISLDYPNGTAQAAEEQGRDALISVAYEEWKNDSTDAAFQKVCADVVAQMPPEQLAPVMARNAKCIAKPSCDEYVTCHMPILEEQFRARGAGQ